MTNVADSLPELDRKAMAGLKDFQKATVARIDELYRAGQMRILISDEVGLGKTLIARCAILKLAQLRKEEGDDLVKIVYICSNAAISEQNLNKLRISREVRQESSDYSRLSMQHLNIFMQENDRSLRDSYIHLIPLTPETSFRMSSKEGTVAERALMFSLLKLIPHLQKFTIQLDDMLKGRAKSSWYGAKIKYNDLVWKCNIKSGKTYVRYMLHSLEEKLNQTDESGVTLLTKIISFCEGRSHVKSGNIISNLRLVFAQISLQKLEPDLVIMDEFQRFRYLLKSDPKSETGMLAEKFFNSASVRMLLLSATPYKMYSTLEEIDESQVDEHYTEFLDLMDFLNISEEQKIKFTTIWNKYSIQLKEFSQDGTTLITAKNAAEDEMYRCICRTERISSNENADMIDDSDTKNPLDISDADIKVYIQFKKMLNSINTNINIPLDYIKSSPYLMSFMRDYKFKKEIEKYFSKNPKELKKINKTLFWIRPEQIERYDRIPTNNARIERLMLTSFEKNAQKLLWVPPSKPYYEFKEVYKNTEGFSKTLVFSAWEMVPRMIATLVSYESERRTIGALIINNKDCKARYFSNTNKRYPQARMRFSVNQGKPESMMLFCLLYPSSFLAKCYDPIDCMSRKMSLREIENEIKTKIKIKLKQYSSSNFGQVDMRWYYIAPLLMDEQNYVISWINKGEVLSPRANGDEEGTSLKEQKTFLAHLTELKNLYNKVLSGKDILLGKKPDDLVDILTDMAIASPSVCVYRTYTGYSKNSLKFDSILPSQVAQIFINRMNTVESTAAVELACGKKSDNAHWKNVLTYSKYGNIQAMFDEYAHLLVSGMDDSNNIIPILHSSMSDGMEFRTTVYNTDTFRSFSSRIDGTRKTKNRLITNIRTHFAVAFIKGDSKLTDMNRQKSVRNAFNSPFRPFVLASTSIAQEGLDFHNYCRRIVHWNLPSNPVDIEQREGRISRFKCLAVRQNVAKRYGDIQIKNDVWTELFEEASRNEKANGCSDLIPYWCVKTSKDMFKIERIVPMYPFSKDVAAYERLVKILSLYRLALGQARQEELLNHIFKNCKNPEIVRNIFINLSPYYRKMQKSDVTLS